MNALTATPRADGLASPSLQTDTSGAHERRASLNQTPIANDGSVALGRTRREGPRRDADIQSRLRKATGQLAGVTAMHADGRYCIDVLDQLSAVSAAVDGAALLVLEDHINACVRAAILEGDTDAKVNELLSAIRRYLRRR